ncbi:MAG: flagellin [Dehalococcoidia bacterium]|nr:flagellin [Dehalococcoidia bacterium]
MVTGISSFALPRLFETQATGALDEIERVRSTLFKQTATGSRLVDAGVDAAGISIANALGAQVRSLAAGGANVQQGISLVQTAEGGLAQIEESVQRIRELSVQAANDTLTDDDRAAIQSEIDELRSQINQTANTTEFNDQPLLNGTQTDPVVVETGEAAATPTAVGLPTATTAALDLDSIDVTTTAGAQAAVATTDTALNAISAARADLGATQQGLEATGRRVEEAGINLTSALSQIQGADIAATASQTLAANLREQATLAVLSQGFANADSVRRVFQI